MMKKQCRSVPAHASFALLLLVVPFTLRAQCSGSERWDVKTLQDSPALTAPEPITIEAAYELTAPERWSVTLPRQPLEKKEVTIKGNLIACGAESDSDFHLVVSDEQGETIIAEIPRPECANPSYASKFQAARDWVVSAIGHYPKKIMTLRNPIPVTVTGFQFFDKTNHNGTGHAPNEYEIHPVLSIH